MTECRQCGNIFEYKLDPMTAKELELWESEAAQQLKPCNDGTPNKYLHERIVSLISEVRRERRYRDLTVRAFSAEGASSNRLYQTLTERIDSAETALTAYASDAFDATSLGDMDEQGQGKLARAHFERFK